MSNQLIGDLLERQEQASLRDLLPPGQGARSPPGGRRIVPTFLHQPDRHRENWTGNPFYFYNLLSTGKIRCQVDIIVL